MRRPSRRIPLAVLLLALVALATPACLELSLNDPLEGPDFVGDWIGVSYRVVNSEAPSQEIDLITDEHWFEFLVFRTGGHHTVTERVPGRQEYADNATWSLSGDVLTLRYESTGETLAWQWHIDGQGRLVMEIDGGRDFDGDGTNEPTHETLVLADAQPNPDSAVVGEWRAAGYTYTSEDGGASRDLMEEGGSLTITLAHQGSFQYAETLPTGDGGMASDSGVGEYAAIEGLIWIMAAPSEVELMEYRTSGNDLLLTAEDAAWDFDGDGADEPAILVIRLTPQ